MKIITVKRKGAALPIAIVAGILLISLRGVLLTTVNNEIKINKASQERIIAKNLAEGAIEHGLYKYSCMLIEAKNVKGFNGSDSIGEIGSYEYTYEVPINDEEKIGTFIGEGITKGGSKYKISAKLDIESGKIVQWNEEK